MKNRIYALRIFVLAVSFLFLSFATGCRQRHPDGMPELYPATFTFTQEGTPMENARVFLFPASENDNAHGWGANGVTNSRGVVQFLTRGQYSGVAPGHFKITVSKQIRDPSTFKGKYTDDRKKEYRQEELKRKCYEYVAPEFRDVSTTPLEIEIVPGKNSRTFDLGKPVKELVELELDFS